MATTDWGKFFSGLSDSELGSIALLRVIECTNGCIQHLYRDNSPSALPIVQTRTAMNYSMGIMKTMEFELAGIDHSFCDNTKEHLQKIRELYVKAFKQNDPKAVDEFMDSSVACAFSLGKDRIIKAGKAVQEALPHVFPDGTVNWGVNYLLSLMAE